jgi:hypothetical protein
MLRKHPLLLTRHFSQAVSALAAFVGHQPEDLIGTAIEAAGVAAKLDDFPRAKASFGHYAPSQVGRANKPAISVGASPAI